MPQLIRKLNHRLITFNNNESTDHVGVLTKNGEYRYIRWMGFVERDTARAMEGTKPVKLKAYAYCAERYGAARVELESGQHVQGCLVGRGVYGVTVGGRPKII